MKNILIVNLSHFDTTIGAISLFTNSISPNDYNSSLIRLGEFYNDNFEKLYNIEPDFLQTVPLLSGKRLIDIIQHKIDKETVLCVDGVMIDQNDHIKYWELINIILETAKEQMK